MQHRRLLSCGGLRWPSIFKSSKVPSTVPEGRREQIRPPGHRTSAVCTWPVCTSGEATPASSEQPSLLDLFRTGGMSVEVIASERGVLATPRRCQRGRPQTVAARARV